MKRFLACALALLMITSAAMAEGKSCDGTVVSTETAAVLAPAAGTVGQVLYQAGERVAASDEIARLVSTTVYAEQSGTVKVFGSEGESVDTLTTRYGAVVYIEPDCQFTVSGNTTYAYDKAENKIIHPGEIVYLRAAGNSTHVAEGVVTAVSGTKYTVEAAEGSILDGETAYIYRDSAYTNESRIGRGTVERAEPIAVTGTGVVSGVLVADGAHVEAGDALFTTVEASAYAWKLASQTDGVVASVGVAAGDDVEAGTLIAQIYPDSAMRVELVVESRDLRSIHVGDPAAITFDNGVSAEGEVERISNVPYVPEDAEEDDETVCFAVYVVFTSDEAIPYGMTAKVMIGE